MAKVPHASVACLDHSALLVGLVENRRGVWISVNAIFSLKQLGHHFRYVSTLSNKRALSRGMLSPKLRLSKIRLREWLVVKKFCGNNVPRLYGEVGDRNTGFFHAQANERRLSKEIKNIKNEDGVEVSSREEIQKVLLQYFRSIFESTHPTADAIEEGCLRA
ncbi:UNVERIFIED_CONTAM: hypothetical protein Sradi_1874200 [Sesamum radiatum]|uniref:Uncharacterized protein n=1 Tax=Sesamum radiatum TaxID=300843 RepID=A0AAW2TYR7_SESRA